MLHGMMVSHPPTRTRLHVLPLLVFYECLRSDHVLQLLDVAWSHLDLAPEDEQLAGKLLLNDVSTPFANLWA